MFFTPLWIVLVTFYVNFDRWIKESFMVIHNISSSDIKYKTQNAVGRQHIGNWRQRMTSNIPVLSSHKGTRTLVSKTKVREHWFPESRRHILTIVLVKIIFTMCRSYLELDLQCFSYLSLESALNFFKFSQSNPSSRYLRMARNTSQMPFLIPNFCVVPFSWKLSKKSLQHTFSPPI